MSAGRRPHRLVRALLLLAALWFAAGTAGCSVLGARVDQPLEAADRVAVEVRVDGATRVLHVITDSAAMARIRAFVDARRGGWEKSWHTAPASHVKAVFYEGEEIRGWFAAGSGFFQAPSRDATRVMRRAGPAELEELDRLLGLPPGSHASR